LRLISDDDKYGPLIQKTKFQLIEGKKIEGNLRIIESKKVVIFLIECVLNKSMFTINSLRFPFVNDDQKLKIIEKLKKEAMEALVFCDIQSVLLDEVFISECKIFS
jgi:hypothetical protein